MWTFRSFLRLTIGCVFVLGGSCRVFAGWQDEIQKDWLLQEQTRSKEVMRAGQVTPQSDAAGGCDGIKSGLWGFHTDHEESPWWQVDLGQSEALSEVRVWNRCDNGMEKKAFRLRVLLSDDGKTWRQVYEHDGTPFWGYPGDRALKANLTGQSGRFVRIQLSGRSYLHLDEVEVFGTADASKNLALNRPADQSSISQWSTVKIVKNPSSVSWAPRVLETVAFCERLVKERWEEGVAVDVPVRELEALQGELKSVAPERVDREMYFRARGIQRRLLLSSPQLAGFDSLLFVKRVPGSFGHMSDQYMGWWSRPGGGLYLLRDFRGDNPREECISGAFSEPGSFLRPMVSFDGKKVLFAHCKFYPNLAAEPNKLNKDNVPEDAFYHLYEMNLDGTGLRRLTWGKYDNFDGRYLPDGRIVFLSTRRGQSVQVGAESAARSVAVKDLPDAYVRCGGGPERPCAVYTLHTMNADGSNLVAISPFEMFEWTPSVGADGRILYSRWDYIDRDNMPYMSLWSMNPDGTNSRIVYKNYTHSPHCTFEPMSIPGSNKLIFTASGHHAQTMGSLVLLDPTVGTEGANPIKRLTPDVPFPEIEGWPVSFFESPWPLSERLHLVAWGAEEGIGYGTLRPKNGMGLYLFDAEGGLEMLYRDPEITSANPIPVQVRPAPPVLASSVESLGSQEGCFLVADVYEGLKTIRRGEIKALRVVAVPAKTQPVMNAPQLGITADDPGKCVLGTVPVEADGSAYFRAPSGVIVFFQALDAQGMTLQTMRSCTYVQPGQTLSCVGCHEPRSSAPPRKPVLAYRREPSRLTPGPEGSWPLRFDRLVQPVLNARCGGCHDPAQSARNSEMVALGSGKLDLSAEKSYESLVSYGKPSVREQVRQRYAAGVSDERGSGVAVNSPILQKLRSGEGHHGVTLDEADLERLVTWLDTYAQRLGSFSDEQERHLIELRQQWRGLLSERRVQNPKIAKRPF